jgi:hypothetical protein
VGVEVAQGVGVVVSKGNESQVFASASESRRATAGRSQVEEEHDDRRGSGDGGRPTTAALQLRQKGIDLPSISYPTTLRPPSPPTGRGAHARRSKSTSPDPGPREPTGRVRRGTSRKRLLRPVATGLHRLTSVVRHCRFGRNGGPLRLVSVTLGIKSTTLQGPPIFKRPRIFLLRAEHSNGSPHSSIDYNPTRSFTSRHEWTTRNDSVPILQSLLPLPIHTTRRSHLPFLPERRIHADLWRIETHPDFVPSWIEEVEVVDGL